jgi:hypothetical protein
MYFEAGVTVTPHMAREFLSRNVENNRPPKKSKIPMYARDMASGNWRSGTGETIKFNTRRELIDGQNRMHAVILANVPVKFDLAHDVSVEVMPVLDSGAARTGADALAISGSRDRTMLSSIVRWAIMWDANLPTGAGPLKPTNLEIVERANAELGLFDACSQRGKDAQRMGLGNGSVAGMAFFVFSRQSTSEGNEHKEFFDAFLSGANLEPGSPILTLRNRMVKAKFDRLTRAEGLALYVRGWNAWLRRETPAQLIIVKGQLSNENFPKVEVVR